MNRRMSPKCVLCNCNTPSTQCRRNRTYETRWLQHDASNSKPIAAFIFHAYASKSISLRTAAFGGTTASICFRMTSLRKTSADTKLRLASLSLRVTENPSWCNRKWRTSTPERSFDRASLASCARRNILLAMLRSGQLRVAARPSTILLDISNLRPKPRPGNLRKQYHTVSKAKLL